MCAPQCTLLSLLPVFEHFTQQSFDGQRRGASAVAERRRRAAEEGELDGSRLDGLEQRQDEQQAPEPVVRVVGDAGQQGRRTWRRRRAGGGHRQGVLPQHRLRLVLVALNLSRVSQVTQLCTGQQQQVDIRLRSRPNAVPQ